MASDILKQNTPHYISFFICQNVKRHFKILRSTNW